MSEKEKNKRREFLNHVCPAVAMAFLGVPAIQSCSSGDDDTDTGSGNNNGGNTGGNTDAGYTKSGNTITIDLNHSNFSNLQSQGWIQFTAEKMLILKLSSSSYKAFDGRCPHQGVYTLLGAITHPITDLLVVNTGILTTQTVSHLEMVGF